LLILERGAYRSLRERSYDDQEIFHVLILFVPAFFRCIGIRFEVSSRDGLELINLSYVPILQYFLKLLDAALQTFAEQIY